MSTKTNAVRLIQQAKISFREMFYEYDENDLSGLHAAEATNMEPEQVFKTLVTRGSRTGIHVFCIPTYFDETCQLYDEIAVSAGERGHQVIVPPMELAGLVQAKIVDIIA